MLLSRLLLKRLHDGGNFAIVGAEILQFQDAILQPDGSYRLSRFLRGRCGTEGAVFTHQTHESFILVDPATLYRLKTPAGDIGLSRVYKAITYGRGIGASTPYSFTNTAQGKKPWSPVHLRAKKTDGEDVAFTWIPRSRIQGAWRDWVDTPPDPEVTGYEIDILNENRVIRTLPTPTETAIYTREQQCADFGEPQTSITLNLYAIGRTVGRGFPATETLPIEPFRPLPGKKS